VRRDEPADPDDTLIEFLVEFACDRTAGLERPLSEYLARFPGRDGAIAAAYADALGVSTPAPEAEDDGERIGEYRLLRELGRGGQAIVWLAEDTRIGRRVALKVVPRPPTSEDLTPRLRREAQAASRVEHPGLCPIFDVGADERQAWIAMRYVDGETLERRLERRASNSLDERLLWIEHVARALHAAHQAGVVHRDVKPGNVMLQPGGEPVVLDFGIARADDVAAQLTRTGDAVGTPAYMAPEQLSGASVDRRCDVWGLGVTAFELCVGRRPFEGPTRDALVRAILDSPAPDARDLEPRLPRDLAVVLATALEKDLSRRYQTALDFAEDLRRVRMREPIRARPASAALKLRRWGQRNPKLAASLAALAVVLVVALVVTTGLLQRTRDALARRDALVRDVSQLSDQTLAAELLEQAPTLWPATEANLPQLERWIERSTELLDRRKRHEAAREALAARTDLDPDPAKNAAAREWLLEHLDHLTAALDRVEAELPRLRERVESARTLRRRSLDAFASEWRATRERVAANARYHGLELAPQLGLAPLGPDPRSTLEEFAHVDSGAIPRRDDRGELVRDGSTAIVFVLLPAGEFELGCELPSDARPLGSPNVDPWCGRWDGPPKHVALDAFFLSKFELTRGQFTRHEGADPSSLNASEDFAPTDFERAPVETISWDTALRFAHELDLELPTEAQWEFGARAGTTTVFYTGDDVASLQGHANVADKTAAESGANFPCELTLDDGFVALAPVGSLAPNPFGLHDVYGNVMEWCFDSWEDLAQVEARAGDGRFLGAEPSRVQRGGSFSHSPTNCRSASRNGTMPAYVSPVWGVRLARPLR